MSDPDATYLTKQQTAAQLGVSTKGVERFVKAGKLPQHWRRQAGTAPVAVFFPQDVADLAATRLRQPAGAFLVPDGTVPTSNGNGHQGAEGLARVSAALSVPLATGGISSGISTGMSEDVVRAILITARVASETSQTGQTAAYVAKAEALAIAGLSNGELRRAVKAGEVKMRGRRYRRQDLEQL